MVVRTARPTRRRHGLLAIDKPVESAYLSDDPVNLVANSHGQEESVTLKRLPAPVVYGALLLWVALATLFAAGLESYATFVESGSTLPLRGAPVSASRLRQLKRGLTHEEVVSIIGTTDVTHPYQVILVKGVPSRWASPEVWEYNWTWGPGGGIGCCPYSHRVWFDQNGCFMKWEGPTESLPLWARLGVPIYRLPWWLGVIWRSATFLTFLGGISLLLFFASWYEQWRRKKNAEDDSDAAGGPPAPSA